MPGCSSGNAGEGSQCLESEAGAGGEEAVAAELDSAWTLTAANGHPRGRRPTGCGGVLPQDFGPTEERHVGRS